MKEDKKVNVLLDEMKSLSFEEIESYMKAMIKYNKNALKYPDADDDDFSDVYIEYESKKKEIMIRLQYYLEMIQYFLDVEWYEFINDMISVLKMELKRFYVHLNIVSFQYIEEINIFIQNYIRAKISEDEQTKLIAEDLQKYNVELINQ